MIARLKGVNQARQGQCLVIDVNGVGYEVFASAAVHEKAEIGKTIEVVVYTDVKEDSITLFGFCDQLERQVFLLLKRVKGIGSKTAADILSKIDKIQLLRIIGSGDLTRLQGVKGVGKKTAERIILELREKVAEYALESNLSGLANSIERSMPLEEALDALKSLGFTLKDAEQALQRAQTQGQLPPNSSTSELVRTALRFV